MTSNYEELANRGVQKGDGHIYQVPAKDLVEYQDAIGALTAQVLERDAVIADGPHAGDCAGWTPTGDGCDGNDDEHIDEDECNCFKSQAPRDALAARDAVRDKTVRATALREAAGSVRPVVIRWEDHGGNIELMLEEWLHARADQEEL
jgi:hypothetical protein